MYREKINELISWKLNKRKKPLLFLGARQVGKTWLLKEFGKTEYKQLVYVNYCVVARHWKNRNKDR